MKREFRRARRALLAALLIFTVALPTFAQDRCFQRVGGVPGAYGQPPNWWTSGSAPLGSATGRWVDDPRWQNASGNSTLSDISRFRGIVETVGADRFLVLMWHVKAAPIVTGPDRNDRLYFGFYDETANRGNVFRIDPLATTATPIPAGSSHADGGYSGAFYNRAGGDWGLNNSGGLVPPLPTWLKNDARVDVFCPGGTCNEWAVRVRVPIVPGTDVTVDDTAGINITGGGNYRFFYQVQSALPGNITALYSFPQGLAKVETEASTTCTALTGICIPDQSNWVRVPDGATCVGDVSITPGDIFVGTPGNHQISLTSANQLKARPRNNTAATQPGGAIQANYKLANWGSTIGQSPTWQTVCSNVVSTGADVASNGNFDLSCNFTVSDPCAYKPSGDACGPQAGSRHPDQCLLVELASAPAQGPYFFSPQSAWRNLMFNGASTFKKNATLDIRGITPLASGEPKRDLYVYVKTANMPAEINSDTPAPGSQLPEQKQAVLKRSKIELPQRGAAVGKETAIKLQEAMKAGLLSDEDVQAIMPTYIAYVWHDTGSKIATKTLVEEQPSFGYLMWHDGGITGWKHKFEGSNVTELAPSFYKVSVPDGGTAEVTTTIEAVEPGGPTPQPTPGTGSRKSLWLILLLALLIVGAIIFVIRQQD